MSRKSIYSRKADRVLRASSLSTIFFFSAAVATSPFVEIFNFLLRFVTPSFILCSTSNLPVQTTPKCRRHIYRHHHLKHDDHDDARIRREGPRKPRRSQASSSRIIISADEDVDDDDNLPNYVLRRQKNKCSSSAK